ncbi:MAG TPA: ABC transporter ATP-binding protein [Candidatus Hydrogenedentes bacterium]|nr:ABC transporter ATP-binding protein [Candidatus Hydrogenedentota bacterium]
MSLLEVENYSVMFRRAGGVVRAVDGVSFVLERGERLGVVGESGSGKTTLFLGLMGLLPRRAAMISGTVRFDGVDLSTGGGAAIQALRGRRMTMVFQDPMTSLNPYLRVETQALEAVRRGQVQGAGHGRAGRARVAALLESVGIPEAGRRARQYPHMFSGGMRQRVMIAMALAPGPDLVIADEPTTALDVTARAQVLDLLEAARREQGMAVILISHDIGMVARHSDRVMILYAGRVMETGPTATVLEHPVHPYTRALLACQPSLARRGESLRAIAGAPPLDGAPERGCAFAERCAHATGQCWSETPTLSDAGDGVPGHFAACWRHGEGLW